MRKGELIRIVARKAHLTKRAADDAIEATFMEIQKALVRGEKIVLSGFGTFRAVSVKDKPVVIPGSGEKRMIKSHRAARFTPGRTLKKIIKG